MLVTGVAAVILEERPKLAHLYGPAARCKLNLQNGSGWSCASVSGPWVERIAPGHHGYPRAFVPNSAIGPRRPDGPPDHERDGETRSPFLKFNSQTSAGYLLLPSGALGLTEAIASEPPSLARPDRRATMSEKGGGHPFGEPE